MAKDWQRAICTTHRPVVIILLMAGLLMGLLGLIALIQMGSENPQGSLGLRASRLSLGMTEAELIKIMGKPQHIGTVSAGEVESIFPNDKKNVEEAIRKYGHVVAYAFEEKRKFLWTGVGTVSGIYLDKKGGKIIVLQVRNWWIDEIIAADYEKFLLLAPCVAVPWIGLSLWCKRLRKRRGSQFREDQRSEAK